MSRTRQHGFSTVELLASVVIFATIMGALFSVIAALKRNDRFRDVNVLTAQAASYTFEPIIRALRSADAVDTVAGPNGCTTIRGFYLLQGGQAQTTFNLASGPTSLGETDKLVVVDTEKNYDATQTIGTAYEWVKRDYTLVTEPNGNRAIRQTTYHVSDPIYAWPTPLDSCRRPTVWSVIEEKELTGPNTTVAQFALRLASPLLDQSRARLAPFATLKIVVNHVGLASDNATPVTLETTITPTFSYGEQRE